MFLFLSTDGKYVILGGQHFSAALLHMQDTLTQGERTSQRRT